MGIDNLLEDWVHLLPAPTIATTMEVVVDELCTNTVANTPNIRSAMGLDRMSFCWKAAPAALPANN